MDILESLKGVAVNLLTDTVKKVFGYLWKLAIAGGIVTVAISFRSFLFTPRGIMPIFILIGTVLLVGLIFLVVWLTRKRKFIDIPVASKFYHGHGPNSLGEKTKWNYKNYKGYYYIPLLSHGQARVEFVDFCGPFCAKCHHLLVPEAGFFGYKFRCLNCECTFRIPSELVTVDYKKRLFQYFETEYKLGKLKEKGFYDV